MTSAFSSWPGLAPRRAVVKASTVSLPPISTRVSSPTAVIGCALGRDFSRVILELALVADLRPVAVGEGAVFFDRLDGGARVAELLDLVLELFFGDFDGGLVDGDVLVAIDGEIGKVLRRRP